MASQKNQSKLILLPGIKISGKMWGVQTQTDDPNLVQEFKYGNAFVTNYSNLEARTDIPKHVKKNLAELKPNILNKDGSEVSDFIVIYGEGAKSGKSDSEIAFDLISYFINYKSLYFRSNLDSIKITFNGKYRTSFTYNNFDRIGIPTFKYFFGDILGYQGTAQVNKTDARLVEILNGIKSTQKNIFDRIVNAIEFFNQACFLQSTNKKIAVLLLVTAFESVLQIPEYAKKEGFVYGFKALFGFNEEIEKWSKALYQYRSKIVHGQPTENDEVYLDAKYKHANHFEIASEIFDACLLLVISNYGLIEIASGYKFRKINDVVDKIKLNTEKISFILTKKSKLKYSELKANQKRVLWLIEKLNGLSSNDFSGTEKLKSLCIFLFSIYADWFKEYRKIEFPPHLSDQNESFRKECEKIEKELNRIRKYIKEEYQPSDFKNLKISLDLFRQMVLARGRFGGFEPASPHGFQDFIEETIKPITNLYWELEQEK